MADVIPFDQRDGSLWYDGKLVPWKDAKTHVLTHGLHYGSCVFEGQRIYGGKIYKLKEHTDRLFRSAETLGMKIPFTKDEINQACIDAAAVQNIKDGYLRPVAFRGSEMMAVSAQNTTIHVAIACWPWPSYFSPAEKLKGIRLDISRWRRPAPDTEPVHAKAAGLYMICTISKHEAEAKGYADALMFDYRGYVAEATGANVFFVQDGVLHTPDAGLFPQWPDPPVGDRHRQGARRQGGGAPYRAGRDEGFHRMLPHRFGGGSDAGVGDRALSLQARHADRNADERLCGRGARRGERFPPSLSDVNPNDQRRARQQQDDAGGFAQLVFWRKTKRVTPCANSTSTSARVRTLAAVASAKARNQNSDAAAPAKPASRRRPPQRERWPSSVPRLNSSSQASSNRV